MDRRTDGVVGRSDLCKLNFNLNDTIGTAYYCAAAAAQIGFYASSATPIQNGTISAEGVAEVTKILEGLKDSDGNQTRCYFL